MSDLWTRLESAGLTQYYDSLVGEGFDTWETILDITESDLNALNFKLGHRRKLQRAIAETRMLFPERAHPLFKSKNSNTELAYRSDDSNDTKLAKRGELGSAGGSTTSTKRKYRRHPKPDEHAPERPPSAYVIFSNQMREELKGKEMTFTEIAKVVGERWQVLSAESRETYEREANAAKEKYYAQLAEYKKTDQYVEYQEYLKEFKAKHAPSTNDGKRSKLDTEQSQSSQTTAQDHAARRRPSHGYADSLAMRQHSRAGSSPPMQSTRPGALLVGSLTNAPSGTYSNAQTNSPRMPDQYSPMSASPRSASLIKDMADSAITGALTVADPRDRYPDTAHAIPPTLQTFHSRSSASTTASTPPPPITTPTPGHYSTRESTRRNFRESPSLPPLIHEDTSLSSDSGHGLGYASIPPHPPTLLPLATAPKAQRILPQPVPKIGPPTTVFDQRIPPPLVQRPPDAHTGSSSLAALLRAGELAREADNKQDQQSQMQPLSDTNMDNNNNNNNYNYNFKTSRQDNPELRPQ